MKTFIAQIKLRRSDGHVNHLARITGQSMQDATAQFMGPKDRDFLYVVAHKSKMLDSALPERTYGLIFPIADILEVIVLED